MKHIRWISLLILLSLVLSACSTTAPAAPTPVQQATQPAAAQPPATKQPVKLTYMLWDSNQYPPYQKCADNFMAKNPNIQIEISQMGWGDYWTTLTTNMVAGNAPDVFTDHLAKYPDFVAKGQLMDLQPFIDRDKVDLSIYLPGLADLWVKDGKRYGLPKDWDTIAVFYSKDMLAKAGVSEEELNKATWNPQDGGTYEQIIAKLTIDENGKNALDPGFDKTKVAVYGLTPFPYDNSGTAYGQTEWSHYAYTNGWKFNDKLWDTKYYYDDPKFVETIAWIQRLMLEKGYVPPLTDIKSLGGGAMFKSSKVAMLTDGSWMIVDYKNAPFPVGVAHLSVGPVGRKSMFNGLSDGIWTGTKHPEEAWQWVKYLASPECANVVGEAGVVFPAQEAAVQKSIAAWTAKGMDVTAFTDEALDPNGTFLFPVTQHANEIVQIMGETLDSIFLGKSDPQTALTEANKKVNALFK